MKKIIKYITDKNILFYSTIIFIVLALLFGFGIDYLSKNNFIDIYGIICICLILFFIAFYLFVGYVYNTQKILNNIYKEKGNLIKLYRFNRLFRTTVNKSFSCTYVLANAFVNFYFSFASYKWYFLSVCAIYFLIFILQLYLLTNIDKKTSRQNVVITILLIFMGVACLGNVVLVNFNQTAYSSKGLIIYWDALYVFVSLISAIVGVVHCVQRKDNIIGKFLSVKLANAIFSMFVLTVTMLMTFSENFSEYILMCNIVGTVCGVLIMYVAVVQLLLSKKMVKKHKE